MKIWLGKLLSLILVLSMILSAFVIFASANEEEDDSASEEVTVIYNRNFSEGWSISNGTTYNNMGGDIRIEYEVGYDMEYNYYLCLEALNEKNDFVTIDAGSNVANTGKFLMEFDVNASEDCNVGDAILIITPGSGEARAMTYIMSVKNGDLYVLGQNMGRLSSDWVHVAYQFDYDYVEEGNERAYKVTAFVGSGSDTVVLESVYTHGTGGKGVQSIRFGYAGNSNNRKGHWYGLDNLKLYNCDAGFVDLDPTNFGTVVNTSKAKDMTILGSSAGDFVVVGDIISSGLVMKVGNDFALIKDQRSPLLVDSEGGAYGAPVVVDGLVMIPLDTLLDYIGYPIYVHPDGLSFDISTGRSATYLAIGRKSATVGGERVEMLCAPGYVTDGDNKYLAIALDDVEALFPGYYVTYDDMGLIIIGKADNLYDRSKDLNAMMDLMKRFVFNYAKPEEILEMAEEATENFTHPYLYADQAKLDELKAAYLAEEGDENYDPVYKTYLNKFISSANSVLKRYSDFDEDGNYLRITPGREPVNPNNTDDGYDAAGGRLSVATGSVDTVAVAYQITGNLDYVRFVYDWIVELGKWDHWGPGHFLNCADATAPIAMAIDWCYNGFEQIGKDVSVLCEILFENGVNMGYLACFEGQCPWPSKIVGNGGFVYHRKANNWNAVCTSGMVAGAAVLLGDERYADKAAYLISDNVEHLAKYGLGQYAPDGSYVESASYWSYGTNTLFRLAMALESVIGTELGFMNTWGIETTCYFACHVESSDMSSWSYHDGSYGALDNSYFAYVGTYFGDEGLVKIRMDHIAAGKGVSFVDLLYYNADAVAADLPLQYHMEGIDGYALRSSWEKGAVYAGIMGGDNSAPHGQLDSGAFIYNAEGVRWLVDLGSDDYNIKNYFSNHCLYRRNAEGNNVLAMTSTADLKYGQATTGFGKIIETFDNEYGAYTIIDNASVYGNKVSYAYRGMMITNDRSTVIVQDEVACTNIETLYWFAHYDLGQLNGDPDISADGRTAYLTSKSGKTLRVSIVSKSIDFKFTLMDCYTYVLGETWAPGTSESLGGQPEHSRSSYKKLVIKAENVLSFNLAVAIEVVNPDSESKVGYEWTNMADWTPYEDARLDGESNDIKKRAAAKRTAIRNGVAKAKALMESNKAFGSDIDNFYRTLTDTAYAYTFFKDDLGAEYQTTIEEMEGIFEIYENHIGAINGYAETARSILGSISGIK